MKPTPLWTGIAALTLALTVAEAAAVGVVTHGAQRWWAGDDARALRRAGSIVGTMVAEQVGLESDAEPVRVRLADLHSALEPVAGMTWVDDGRSSRCVIKSRELRAKILEARARTFEARIRAREELRQALRIREGRVL